MGNDGTVQSSTVSARLDAPTQSLDLSGDLAALADRMEHKAQRAKLTANICVTTTLVIGSSILASFLWFSQVTASQRAERQKDC
jgi:hypothetical protein